MKSFAIVPHPIAHGCEMLYNSALRCAKTAKVPFESKGTIKNKFLQMLSDKREALSQELEYIPESKWMLSDKASEVEAFFESKGKKGGRKVKLTKVSDLFYANYLYLEVQWKKKGSAVSIKRYKGFKLSEGYVVEGNTAVLPTKSGDLVVLKMCDPKNELQLFDFVAEMKKAVAKNSRLSYGAVQTPCCRLDYGLDFTNWFGSYKHVVGKEVLTYTSCLQQSLMLMDEVGVRIEAKTTMSLTKSIKPKDFIIDKPFVMAVFRTGLTMPIYAAYVSTDAWVK